MSLTSNKTRPAWNRAAIAALVAGTFGLAATAANAGVCPADKVVADGLGQKPGATAPKDVTDVTRTSIDLAKEPIALNGRLFRMRQLEIKPGGVVPWHSHGERPAIIYIVSGQVTEYASNCTVPIVHKAGEVSTETSGKSHWWKNTGNTTAVLISADLFPVENQKDAKLM